MISQNVWPDQSKARGRLLGSRGCSSDGRALPSHGRGQGFNSPHLHAGWPGVHTAEQFQKKVLLRNKRVLGIAVVGLILITPACTQTGSTSVPTDPTTVSSTTAAAPPTTGAPAAILDPASEVPAELKADLEDLVLRAEELRQLPFINPPLVKVVSGEELERLVREDLAEELEGIEIDQTVYQLLGLLPPEVDLGQLYLDLYGTSVGGFYDGDTGELVVPASPDGLTILQRSTLIHELTHALTDQHFQMWDSYQALLDDDRFDEATAMLGVIEGDAVLTEVLYAQGLTNDERDQLFRESFDVDDSVLRATPLFIRDALVFPYSDGFEFVLAAFQEGGHSGVDDLYLTPPLSTEEIFIQPEREFPIAQSGEVPEIAGYEVDSDGTWGALSWKLMFDQVIGGSEAAVQGWGGDRGVVYTDGSNVVLTIVFDGDTPQDVEELRVALDEYFTAVSGAPGTNEGTATVYGESSYAGVGLASSGGLVLVVSTDAVVGAKVFAELAG